MLDIEEVTVTYYNLTIDGNSTHLTKENLLEFRDAINRLFPTPEGSKIPPGDDSCTARELSQQGHKMLAIYKLQDSKGLEFTKAKDIVEGWMRVDGTEVRVEDYADYMKRQGK